MTRHLYDVPDWGVGAVWALGGTIVQHELASEELRHTAGSAPPDASVEFPAAQSASAALPVPAGPVRLDGSRSHPRHGGATVPARTLPAEPSQDCAEIVTDLCRRIVAHLSGAPTTYHGIPIDLGWATPLQRELAAAARAIPWGEVVSYGELAALAGRPGAARAAGSFCADNTFSLIVPCHRVVAANGIGGYGPAGVGLKRRLLALEGVEL